MGDQVTKMIREQAMTFMSADGATYKDMAKHFYEQETMQKNEKERYEYIDDIISDNPEIG